LPQVRILRGCLDDTTGLRRHRWIMMMLAVSLSNSVVSVRVPQYVENVVHAVGLDHHQEKHKRGG